MNREQYIEKELRVLRERQVIELERARCFFGDEWDKEYGDQR